MGSNISKSNFYSNPIWSNWMSSFDIKKFMGKWYEIASTLPNTEYDYTTFDFVVQNSMLKVIKTFYTKNKENYFITGDVLLSSPKTPYNLKISFYENTWKSYNIVWVGETDSIYDVAIVFLPPDNVWILSRTKKISYVFWDDVLELIKLMNIPQEKLTWNTMY